MRLRLYILTLAVGLPLLAQSITVDAYNSYHRIYAIVPVVGAGSSQNSVRPLYAPTMDEIGAATGILAFTSELSDDSTHALIEIVTRNRSAFARIQADSSVLTFEKGNSKPSDIENAFAKYKPTFHFSQFNEVSVR